MTNGITIAPDVKRYNIRGRDPALIEATTGLDLPRVIGETKGDVAMLGPDEWLALLPPDRVLPLCAEHPLSIVDVSDRQIGVIVEGAAAIDILSAGCPLDLALWPIGRGSRTIFELVEVVIIREGVQRFRLEVWRSFAPWLIAALETASNNLTTDIA